MSRKIDTRYDLTEAEIIQIAEATKPILKSSRTTRIKGDLLRKKAKKSAEEWTKKGW